MKAISLAPGVYHLRGGSNAGVIAHGKDALLVDTGLDRDAGRKIVKFLAGEGLSLAAIVITHAHADHFGGAAFVRRRTGALVHAPRLTAAIVENPILEPTYLFAGADPIPELRHKFTLAPPCPVDEILPEGEANVEIGGFEVRIVPAPGHAPDQIMVGFGDVLFSADAFFPTETVEKHGIPFFTNPRLGVETLRSLPEKGYSLLAPGHGDAIGPDGDDIAVNIERLETIRGLALEAIAEPASLEQVQEHVAAGLGVEFTTAVSFYLARTTVQGALAWLEEEGEAFPQTEKGRLLWHRK